MKTLVMNANTIEMNRVNTNPDFINTKDTNIESYMVVHPLFDVPEEKVDTDSVKPLVMSKTVIWSLISLRAYLVIMVGLAFYRTFVLAGIF